VSATDATGTFRAELRRGQHATNTLTPGHQFRQALGTAGRRIVQIAIRVIF